MNKNPIRFKGEALVEVKTEKFQETLSILITENENTQPLLGLDWLDQLEIGLQGNNNTNIIRHIETAERREKIISEHKDLFKNNHTIKDLTIDINLKPDSKLIQQKGRPVPIHFQKTVEQDLEKLIKTGHLEKADKTTENCFISPAVITIKKDKSVKIALDSRKLNEACVKRKRQQCQTLRYSLAKYQPRSRKIMVKFGCQKLIWIIHTDKQNYPEKQPDIMYFQSSAVTLPATTDSKRAFTGYRIYQPDSRSILEFKTPVWLDDIISVTNGSIDEYERELREVLNKTQTAGYRASEKKTELFKQELTWLGNHINQSGVKPIKDKTEAITKLSTPKNAKKLKSFLGSIQHLSKFMNNLSKKTDRMRKLLKKETHWEWTPEINKDLENLKKDITEAPCLAHFDPKKDNYVTTDACNTGQGATLWQKEG